MEEEAKTAIGILSGKNCCHSALLNIKFNTVKPSTWVAYFHWKGEISTAGRDEFAAHHDRKRTSRDYEIVAVFIRGAQKSGSYHVRLEKQERGNWGGRRLWSSKSRANIKSRIVL